MAWLFSCFRCKQKRQSQYSSPHANYKISVEKPVLRNTSVQELQGGSLQSYTCAKQSLEQTSKQGNDADKSLFLLLKTETTCCSPNKQLSHKPVEKERLQQIMTEVKGMKDLKDEASDLTKLLVPLNNVRTAFDGLQVDSEEEKVEKGRPIGCLRSQLTKIDCEGKTAILDDSTLQEQNKLDNNHGVDLGALPLSTLKIESQQYDNKASKELCDSASRFSLTTHKGSSLSLLEEETDLPSPVQNLLAKTFQNSRGCLTEIRSTQSRRRRDELSESTPRSTGERLPITRSKRFSKALSFSEFSLVEAVADSKLTLKELEFKKVERTESSVATRTVSSNKIAALRGATEETISGKFSTNASGSLPTSGEQAVSFSVSQDVGLSDTDIEVDSNAVESCLDESSHGRSQHGYTETPRHNAQEMPLCTDSANKCSQAFTYEDSYDGISEASQSFNICNREQRLLDEEVDEPAINQRDICYDASYFSPSLQRLSTREPTFVKGIAHLQETPFVSSTLQDKSSHHGKSKLGREPTFLSLETPGTWMKRLSQESLKLENEVSFAEASSKEINLVVDNRQVFANIADLTDKIKFVPSKFSDDVTLKPIRRSIDMSPDSCIEHRTEISYDKFASPEAALFLVPSPETVTSKIPMPSPSLLGSLTEDPSTQRVMLSLPHETPSVLRSVQGIPCTNSLKQQPTPRTPSVSSSEVETPSSIPSAVSPADLEQDRPILGTVAAHWTHSSSKEKWWDGKGIPNSTNKYKEDQKVSWHATPFEVRLERALAKQGRVFQKKLFGGSMHTDMERRTEPIISSG